MSGFIVIAFIYLTILVLVSVFRKEASPAERRVALLIGNTAYTSPGLNRLEKAVKDASDVANALERLGFEVVEKHNFLVDERERLLGDFKDKARDAAWVLLYYSGHGMEWDGKNWLIPVDAHLNTRLDIPDQAVSVDHLLEHIPRADKLRIVILDACRDCPSFDRMIMNEGLFRVTPGLAPMKPAYGDVVFFAARHGTKAWEGPVKSSPSLFTEALLKYMEVEGLELGRFFRKVTHSVLEACEAIDSTGRVKQEPFVYGHIPDEDFYFKPPRQSR
jgi:uncharacterized caspase-like protein